MRGDLFDHLMSRHPNYDWDDSLLGISPSDVRETYEAVADGEQKAVL